MLDKVLDILAPGWVGSLIGIVGIAAAVVTYLLTRQRTLLSYRVRGVLLLGHAEAKLPPGVTVQYHGTEIPRLTRSVVVLWNDGEKTVQGTDIVESDPLRIAIDDDCQVVACTLLKTSRPAIRADVALSSGPRPNIILNFDFLDSTDGLVVEVLHTGKVRYLTVVGTVRGLPHGVRNRGRVLSQRAPTLQVRTNRTRRALAIAVLLIGFAFAIGGFFATTAIEPLNSTNSTVARYALVFAGASYSGLGLLFLWLIRKRYPKALHTEELE